MGYFEPRRKKASRHCKISRKRLDDETRYTAGSGPAVAPYINIWITDGAGKFAVIANEPSNPEWSGAFNDGYDITWDYLKTKTVKVYENNDKTWLPSNGVGLTFEDLADYTILAPTVAQLTTGWSGLGSGAPRELGTNIAYGINWVLGDTQANYVSGSDGYILAQPVALAPPTDVWVDDDFDASTPGWGYDHFDKIQDGIDAVVGSTVHVAAGTYAEQVVINKSLNLIGESGAVVVSPTTRNTYQIPENTRVWDPVIFVFGGTETSGVVSGSDVIDVNISNLEIDGSNNATSHPTRYAGVLLRNVNGNIQNCTLHDLYDADGKGNGIETFGITLYGNSNMAIQNNEIRDFSRGGIAANGDNGALTDPVVQILNNDVYGNGLETETNWWAENGIQIGWGASGNIEGNNVYSCRCNNPGWASTAIMIYSGFDEILGNHVEDSDFGIYVNTQGKIENNTVTNNDYGILDYYNGTPATSLLKNTISSNYVGIYALYGTSINENEITTNDYGIYAVDENCLINDNKIVGNTTYGVAVSNSVLNPVNAKQNWWGDNCGPSTDGEPCNTATGSGDVVSCNVDFDPWYGSEVYVDDSYTGTEWGHGMWLFNTIQEGIDATCGSTVHVAAGVYNEKAVIDKPVNVIGENGAEMNGSTLGLVAGVKIESGDVSWDNVDVVDFGGNGIIVGYESTPPGDLQNVKILNTYVANIQPGSSHGFGIYVGYEGEGFDNGTLTDHLDYSGLELRNNQIYNTANAAIVLQSIKASTGSLVVDGNICYEADASGLWIDGARNLEITNNIFKSNSNGIFMSSIGDGWYVTDGAYGPKDINIELNEFTDNSGFGIVLYAGWPGTMNINYNSITGNGTGLQNYLSSLVDAEYNWWGHCSGPSGEGPGTGDAVSTNVDYDPWIGNSFGDPALWLTPIRAKRHGDDMLANIQQKRLGDDRIAKISAWPSADCDPKEAEQNIEKRQPQYENGWVWFESFFDVSHTTGYGENDVMTVDYAADITAEDGDGVGRWTPSDEKKDLFVSFQTGDNVNGTEADLYYRDGRQCIFEAGGPLCGYNLYIVNGKLVFGMWNRFEQKYTILEDASLYPLTTNKTYYAHLSYDGAEFLARVSDGLSLATSPGIAFQGLSQDNQDMTGVGGAARTRYHDYSTGETYSDEFNGMLGDVIVYNGENLTDLAGVTAYFNDRYQVPGAPYSKQGDSEWKVFAHSDITGDAQVSTAWPNPFANTSSFGLNLPMGQNVTIELIDAMGRTVQTIHNGSLGEGQHEFTIDGGNLANGMYIYRATGENFSTSGSVVLSK